MFFFELPNNFWTNKKKTNKSKAKKKKMQYLLEIQKANSGFKKKRGVISTLK